MFRMLLAMVGDPVRMEPVEIDARRDDADPLGSPIMPADILADDVGYGHEPW